MPIYKMNGTKNGKQKYRVRINYVDNLGRSKQIERVAYGMAEAKELEMRMQYEIKEKPVTCGITLQQLYNEYVRALSPEVRESTITGNKKVFERYVLESLGQTQIKKITAPIIQNWKNEIEDVRTSQGAPLSLRYKQNIYSIFRAVLNWGVKMDYLSQNVLVKVGNFKSGLVTEKRTIGFYTAEEFKLFSAAAKEQAICGHSLHDWDYYVFFSIAFYTGLRKGEIHALKWSDINGNLLNVSRSITQKLKGVDRETPPKNSSSIRTLQMPLPLMEILDEHKSRYEHFKGFSDDFRICGGTRSLRDTSVENKNQLFAKLAGIKKIRIHDFRHSHVSLLANEGINIQEIARRLGHSDIEMTWNTYSHLYPREEERAVEILNKIK
jgi:integrase